MKLIWEDALEIYFSQLLLPCKHQSPHSALLLTFCLSTRISSHLPVALAPIKTRSCCSSTACFLFICLLSIKLKWVELKVLWFIHRLAGLAVSLVALSRSSEYEITFTLDLIQPACFFIFTLRVLLAESCTCTCTRQTCKQTSRSDLHAHAHVCAHRHVLQSAKHCLREWKKFVCVTNLFDISTKPMCCIQHMGRMQWDFNVICQMLTWWI